MMNLLKKLIKCLPPHHFIHNRFSQIIFKATDYQRYPVKDYDLVFTAGEKNDANHLPARFAIDRQQNKNNPETITYLIMM